MTGNLQLPGPRSVPEWIGKTPDTPVPPRVKLRVLERHGFRCYLTNEVIKPGDAWDVDHVIAIINFGQNRESNLAPALKRAHQIKTRSDTAAKTKRTKSLKKRYGLTKPKCVMPGSKASGWKRHFDGRVTRR